MPLSEEEQRILHQIEQQFYESDPRFAQSVSKTSLYRHALRQVKFGVAGLVVGLVVLVALLPIHTALSFLGFVLMLGSAFVIERNARAMGREGLRHLAGTGRTSQLSDLFNRRRRPPE